MVLYRFPIMILTLSIVYIFIAPDEPFSFKLFFKLLPMFVIIFYAFRLAPKEKKTVHIFILAGLILSMIGDATMHWFFIGLAAFFLAHLSYTIGFFSEATFTKPRLLAAVPIAIYAVIFALYLLPALRENEKDALILPVLAYIIIIAIMLFAAISTGNIKAMLGALLFMISDSILAWNMFIQPVIYAEALVMFSYYGAQLLIAVSLFSFVERKRRIVW